MLFIIFIVIYVFFITFFYFLAPIYYGNFNESSDNVTSFSVDPLTNYFVNSSISSIALLPSFTLGSSTVGSLPLYDRVLILFFLKFVR